MENSGGFCYNELSSNICTDVIASKFLKTDKCMIRSSLVYDSAGNLDDCPK